MTLQNIHVPFSPYCLISLPCSYLTSTSTFFTSFQGIGVRSLRSARHQLMIGSIQDCCARAPCVGPMIFRAGHRTQISPGHPLPRKALRQQGLHRQCSDRRCPVRAKLSHSSLFVPVYCSNGWNRMLFGPAVTFSTGVARSNPPHVVISQRYLDFLCLISSHSRIWSFGVQFSLHFRVVLFIA
jgi:hypothetical protein